MTESDNIVYEENNIVIQYKADKHIKFFGDFTEIINPFDNTGYIRVKYDKYNNGIGTYIINANFSINEMNVLMGIIDGNLYIGGIGYVYTNDNTIIYPTDNTIAIVTEITILNGGIHMNLFNYYKEFVKKITVKSNNFNIIPDSWCINYDSLEEIELGEGVITIGDYAFIQNSSLKHVILPSSVEYIGYNIIRGINYNVEITYLGTKNQWDHIGKSSEWNDGHVKVIHCTNGDIEL